VYLPNFVCGVDDFSLFDAVMREVNGATGSNVISWSKHHKLEEPTFSATFNALIARVAKHFKMEVMATRLNYYKNYDDHKPYHHDSHAYSNNIKENFTFGISLGASRKLSFMHVATGNKFDFPQCNGDVFAFDDVINRDFMHGVPKEKGSGGGLDRCERLSIVAWGNVSNLPGRR
jgi:hypothetical protein